MDSTSALKRLCLEFIRAAINPYHFLMVTCLVYAIITCYDYANNWTGLPLYFPFWRGLRLIIECHFRSFWLQLVYPWNCLRIEALCGDICRDIRDYLFNLSYLFTEI